MRRIRTQVAIVGAGPAGLFLSHSLTRLGIGHVVVEARSEQHIRQRVRAGLLEHGTVRLLREVGLADRLDRECLVHSGFELRSATLSHRFPTTDLVGLATYMYGQQELVKDMLAARSPEHGEIFFDASDVTVAGFRGDTPTVNFDAGGCRIEVSADFVAGCDGFHGVCRPSAAPGVFSEFTRDFSIAWLGILAETAPISEELIYAAHHRGFALQSMRTPQISRLYLQVPPSTDLADWPDERIFEELRTRLCLSSEEHLDDGPVLERVLVHLRSFTTEPMQTGRLFLVGDAAHIFPPSAAKGLNAALADSAALSAGFAAWYLSGKRGLLDSYSDLRLPVIRRAQEFSEWMTWLLHQPADSDEEAEQHRTTTIRELASSPRAASTFVKRYLSSSVA